MADNCPVCNFHNPCGAQVCGECGHDLGGPRRGVGTVKDGVTETRKDEREAKKSKQKGEVNEIKWEAIGLLRIDKDRHRQDGKFPLIMALTIGLFLYGLIILIYTLVAWFKPVLGVEFIFFREHFYPLLLGIFLGLFTMFLAYGIYQIKQWIVQYYLIWIALQIIMLFMLRGGWWRPAWFIPRYEIIFSLIISVEILLFPVILKLKRKSLTKHT